MHWISPSCQGEVCGMCYREAGSPEFDDWEDRYKAFPATHKVGEEMQGNVTLEEVYSTFAGLKPFETKPEYDPYEVQYRHNLTQYVCCKHFCSIMGLLAAEWCKQIDPVLGKKQ